MTLDDLTVNFRHLDRANLLSDWRWLTGQAKLPIMLTAAGDAFLQDAGDGSVHFLDVTAGQLVLAADSLEAFNALLKDRAFVMDRFSVELIADLRQQGHTLSAGQIFSFKTPPVLGGTYALDNFEPTDIEVHFTVLGQIHEQVSKLPPGTAVKGVHIK